jgi:hypothetical protein
MANLPNKWSGIASFAVAQQVTEILERPARIAKFR